MYRDFLLIYGVHVLDIREQLLQDVVPDSQRQARHANDFEVNDELLNHIALSDVAVSSTLELSEDAAGRIPALFAVDLHATDTNMLDFGL